MSRWKLSILFVVLILSAAIPSFSVESKEEKLGKQTAEQLDDELEFITDEKIIERVNHIGQTLAQVANTYEIAATYGESRLAGYSYKFKVVDNKEINAFSLPGGYIYVYKGLIDFAKSDDELAGVLAHEIAHASHHHVLAMSKKQTRMDLMLVLVALAGGLGKMDNKDLVNVVYGMQAIRTARLSSLGQEAEYDADRTAAIYMVKAGYDPRAMISFFDRLNSHQMETGTVRNLGIFQTHPGTEDRLIRIAQQCQEMGLEVDMRDITKMAKAEAHPIEVNNARLWKVTLAGKDVCIFSDDAKARADGLCKAINEILREEPERLDISLDPDNGELRISGKPVLSITRADCAVAGMEMDEMLRCAAEAIKYAVWSDQIKKNY